MSFTREQVSDHNTKISSWIIIDNNVYDITKFAILHPGGKQVLLDMAGKEATKEFESFHKSSVLKKYHDKLFIGEIIEEEQIKKKNKKEFIPYSEPKWLQGSPSPYYNKSHFKFNQAVKEFTEKELLPNTFEWEDVKKEVPKSFRIRCGDVGLLSGLFGKWPKKYIPNAEILNGISPDEYNYFHELILIDQMSKCASFGVLGNIFVTHTIGLSPIINFASQYLQDKVVPSCLSGEKMICLAVTEPNAGSDVASLSTTAKKSSDGKFYILNGEKKFITNGIWGDYFTVAARTGGPGMSGISVFLVEKEMIGVKTRRLQMQGSWSSGTSYVTFENVKVPTENLIGNENEGFKYVMYNFNHERWGGIVQALRYARVCYEDAYRYAFKRKTFGKKLIEHQVIRQKLGDMIRQIESAWSWLEYITYQMCQMSHEEQNIKLGGDISFLKVQTTKLVENCAREAVQIFGGLGYSRGGQGERVERIYRDVRVLAIGGGSEEVMLDFGVRATMRMSRL